MRVIVAVDGSYHSMYAVEVFAGLNWGDNVRVRVVNAIVPPFIALPDASGLGFAPAYIPNEQVRQATAAAERLVQDAGDVLRGRGFVVEGVVREGDPRSVILAEAEGWSADLIVLGSHGFTGVKRLLLGSVANHVASHARCSVQIVRKRPAAGEE